MKNKEQKNEKINSKSSLNDEKSISSREKTTDNSRKKNDEVSTNKKTDFLKTDEFIGVSSEEINKAIKCGCRVVLQHDAEKGISYDILVEKEYWKNLQKDTKAESIKTLAVPGFRRGKAPAEEIKRIVTDDYVLNIAAQEASKHASIVINSNKKVKNQSKSDFYVVLVKLSKEEIVLNYSFIVRPEVDIRFLEDFKITLPQKPRVNQSDFQKMIKNQIKTYAGKSLEVKRTIQTGDIVKIDFSGYDKDDKKIPSTEGTDYSIEIGSKTFIPGFEDNLIGLKVNDEKSFKINFPAKYFNQKLQGTEVRFEVKVRNVLEIQVPEQIDDELIKSFKIDKVADLSSFHNHCHRILMNEANSVWSQQINNIAIEEMLKAADLKIDSKIIKSEINAVTHSLSEQARINKLSPEDVAARSGIDPKNIMKGISDIATKRVKLTIIIREYIKEKKITIQQKEAQERYAEYLKSVPKGTEKIDIMSEQVYVQNLVRNMALKQMIEQIYENSDRVAQAQRRSEIMKTKAKINKKVNNKNDEEQLDQKDNNPKSTTKSN